MDGSMYNQVIRREPMYQLTEALDEDDDWTGLTDAAARRKKQNRLNQRAFRRRKAEESNPKDNSQHANHQALNQSLHYQEEEQQPGFTQMTPQGQQVLHIVLSYLHSHQSIPPPSYSSSSSFPSSHHIPTHFPLTTDHLIPLIQLNVLRATLTNLSLLSLLHSIPSACGSAAYFHTLLHPHPGTIPRCLAPTALQQSTAHSTWIDIIPSPTMRDNCIRLADLIDEDDLCSDFVGGLYDGRADSDTKGWIVWRDPWDISGWEVTEGFVRKWGYLLRGCEQIIEASNRWRAVRGEDALVVEV